MSLILSDNNIAIRKKLFLAIFYTTFSFLNAQSPFQELNKSMPTSNNYNELVRDNSNIVVKIDEDYEITIEGEKVFVWDEIFTTSLRLKNYDPVEIIKSKLVVECDDNINYQFLFHVLEELARLPLKIVFFKTPQGFKNDIIVHNLPYTRLNSLKESSIFNKNPNKSKYELESINLLEKDKNNKLLIDKGVFSKIKSKIYLKDFDSIDIILKDYPISKLVVHPNQKYSLNATFVEDSDLKKVFELYWENHIIFIFIEEDVDFRDYLHFLNAMKLNGYNPIDKEKYPGLFLEIPHKLKKELLKSKLNLF
ncbi:MAG: hypothetical protein ABGX00_16305 [Allomuricauda sp.]